MRLKNRRRLLLAPALTAVVALIAVACSSDTADDQGAAEQTATAVATDTTSDQAAAGTPEPEVFDQPVALLGDGAVRVGQAQGAERIDVFVDFMCPHCAEFHDRFGAQIDAAITAGDLVVDYRYLDFLNRSSTDGDYSTRAAAAARCVAAEDDSAALTGLSDLLFTSGTQPLGGTLTDEQLAEITEDAGADADAVACVADGGQVDQAAGAAQDNERVLQDAIGKVGTPVVLHDGENVDISDDDWLTDLLG